MVHCQQLGTHGPIGARLRDFCNLLASLSIRLLGRLAQAVLLHHHRSDMATTLLPRAGLRVRLQHIQ